MFGSMLLRIFSISSALTSCSNIIVHIDEITLANWSVFVSFSKDKKLILNVLYKSVYCGYQSDNAVNGCGSILNSL